MKKRFLFILITFVWIVATHFSSAAQSGKVSDTTLTTTGKSENLILRANNYVPNSVAIDKTKAVGEIPIQSGVSPTGSVTYQVPVEVYPGIHGMQPQLSINYNSLSGNGLFGVGWSLSGLSCIVRSSKNYYFDNKVEAIGMNPSDVFFLDGIRLIKISETTIQIKYESEQGNIKATAWLNGSVVKYFEVFYPNGTKGLYGYPGNDSINYLEYPLINMLDLHNNIITYTYTYTDNHYRILKISYANASIDFVYSTRPDILLSYSGGFKVTENQRIQSIACKYGSFTLRTYKFEYIIQRDLSLLNSITCSGSDGSTFNPLKFYYGENNIASDFVKSSSQLMPYFQFNSTNQIKVCKGKFDNNTGDDGIILFPNKNPYVPHSVLLYQYFSNEYNGSEDVMIYTNLKDNNAYSFKTTTGTGFIDILCANLDGKEGDEIIKVNNVVSDNKDRIIFTVFTKSYTTGLMQKYIRTFDLPTVMNGLSIHPKYYYTGDFNGDGKMEILAVSCNKPLGYTSNPSLCYLFDLEANKLLHQGLVGFDVAFSGTSAFDNTDRFFVGDYNGDGKSEFCIVKSTGVYVYRFETSGSTYSLIPYPTYNGLNRGDLVNRSLLLGELNGDGKPDFLLSPPTTNSYDLNWSVFYSKGDGQFEKTVFNLTNNGTGMKFYLQDINGDGLSDLIKEQNNLLMTFCASNNIINNKYLYAQTIPLNSIVVPFDLNGWNYQNQIITVTNTGIVNKYSHPRNEVKERLLTGMVTGFGVVHKNYYRMLYENTPFYTPNYVETFPYHNFQGPLFALESTEQYLNGKQIENQSYNYYGAIIHLQGRGFCGFEKITSTDKIRGARQVVRNYDPCNFGILKEEDSNIGKNTYKYSISVAPNKIASIRLIETTVQDKLKNLKTTSNYTYDTYGNLTGESTDWGGGISSTIYREYFNNPVDNGYYLGFMIKMTSIRKRNGVSWEESYYVPAHTQRQPSIIYRYRNGGQVSYEGIVYNTQGNPIIKEMKSYSSPNLLSTSFVYDSYGRLIKETDPMGFNTTYEYNVTNGSLSLVKNHKAQATVYSYDVYGRNSRIDYPDGVYETTAFSWDAKGQNGLYSIRNFQLGKNWKQTYFDALGREVGKLGVHYLYVNPFVEKQYDSYGRLLQESLPYTGTSASYWNTYQYDIYDRPTSITAASGAKTTFSYNGSSVTTTRDGIASTQTFDTQGNLAQVTDPTGTIAYNFRPDGQYTSIIAPGSVTTSFTYDSYGRKSTIVDPSAGTQTYTYDVKGNVASEKDSNGKTITYDYDNYNRLIKTTRPEFITTYVYNSDGLLASETSTNGTSLLYTYDVYGRLQKEKETVVDGKWLEKTHTYADGNLQFTQYASQSGNIVTEKYVYDGADRCAIKLDGTTYILKISSNNVNNFGQVTSITTGSFNRTYGFNTYGIPTGRTAGTFQSHTYGFDATKGNLSSRKDNVKNIQENFTYDNLNRLTGFAGKTAAYNLNGNLISRSDAGTFQYNTAGKLYALSGVTSPTNLIPQRNQTVTYTSFQRPASISEGEYAATFTYNGGGSRVKMEMKKNGVKEMNRYYISDCYEIDDRAVGGIKEKLYLGGDFYTAHAVYVKENGGNWNIYYICRDYLGSITHITNSSGSVVQELSCDAWGQLRNPANQAVYASGSEPESFLGRGYTGHEHLTQFGLINMNARLYDPAVGRFLSPDPFVQNPLLSQNFNRYSYALNNPLLYIDNNGEIAWLIPAFIFIGKAALTGAIIHAGMYTLSVAMSPGGFNNWSWSNFGYATLNGAINGAISGATGFFGMPSLNLGGGFSIGIQPNLMISSNGMGFGATVGLDYGITKWMSAGIDVGVQHQFMTTGTEKYNEQMFTLGYGLEFGNKKNNVSLYSTHYAATDGSSQRVGGLGVNIGKFNMRYENDGAPPFWGILGSNKDQYRTAAAQIGWGDYNLRLNMMTGPGSDNKNIDEYGSSKYPFGYYTGGGVDNVRLGALSLGYKNYRIGANSEGIRHVFQNQLVHNTIGQAGFKVLNNYWYPYYRWGTTNRYGLW